MDICSSGHGEICYDSWVCPLCDTINDFTGQIEVLNKDIKSLELKNGDLQNQLENTIVGDSDG